jgi:hypothetical protein
VIGVPFILQLKQAFWGHGSLTSSLMTSRTSHCLIVTSISPISLVLQNGPSGSMDDFVVLPTSTGSVEAPILDVPLYVNTLCCTLGLYFSPENEGNKFPRNVGICLPYYKDYHLSRYQYLETPYYL